MSHVIQKNGNLTLSFAHRLDGDVYLMSGGSSDHSIAVSCSPLKRVQSHWEGYQENNGLSPVRLMETTSVHSDCKVDVNREELVFSDEWVDCSYGNDEKALIIHKPTMCTLWIGNPNGKRFIDNKGIFSLYHGVDVRETFDEWCKETDMQTDWYRPITVTNSFSEVVSLIETLKEGVAS